MYFGPFLALVGLFLGPPLANPMRPEWRFRRKTMWVGLRLSPPPCPASAELELGLGLALGGGGGGGKVNAATWGERGRILTAQDFPVHGGSNSSSSSSCSRPVTVSGTKRAADSAPNEGGSPTALNQVVGWPPIRTYRMNSLVNQAKTARAEEEDVVCEEKKDQSKDSVKNKTCCDVEGKGNLGFVKVNVDGVVIGRKVDLNVHSCYETLALMLEDMFFRSAGTSIPNGQSGDKEQARKLSKLLDGSSEFVLTYEDREGDWMLVGDVPWGDVPKLGSKTSHNENIRSQRTSPKIPRQETETKEQAHLKSNRYCLYRIHPRSTRMRKMHSLTTEQT